MIEHPDVQTSDNNYCLEKRRVATENLAAARHPGTRWVSTTAELQSANDFTRDLVLPQEVRIARARLPRNKNDKDILAKELRQAKILTDMGNVVYLTPEPHTYKKRVSDAIVNGEVFEFREITGNARRLESEFSDAKKKGKELNVFISIESDISKDEAMRRIRLVLSRHPDYSGKIILSFGRGKTYFWETKLFRQ